MKLDKMEKAVDKVGGRFKLTVLLQKRLVEIRRGADPLISDEETESDYDTVLEEILQGKISMEDLDEVRDEE